MAVVSAPLLKAMFIAFKAEFQRVFKETPSDYAQIATLVPSTTASNVYGWLGQFPKLQEWIGDRVLRSIKQHGYSIENKLFESTVDVPRTAIEDDAYGIFKPMFAEMGRAARVFPDELAFPLLADGMNQLCFDGQNFFDTDHPVYANVDGTGAAATVSNFDAGTDPAWFLLDTSRALKPLIFQERTKPELESQTDTGNDTVFMKDKYLYGIRYRCNVGFAFWQIAYCSQLPLTTANFNKALTAMQNFKADGGRPLGIKPTVLVVPPSLEKAAEDIVVVDRLSNGASNTNKGKVKLIATPWLA